METQIYTPQPWINLRQAIENAQRIADVLKSKKITLNYNGVMLEISANTNMQHAINKYLSILDKIYREQKVK
jgi:hypothetical protein